MDCVESALKLGARDAYLVYRRSFAQMPAEEDERLAALRLGVHFLLLNQPVQYVADGQGKLAGDQPRPHPAGHPRRLGPPRARRRSRDRSGRWRRRSPSRPSATGPDSADWSAAVKMDRTGLILADAKTGKTSAQGVFAGGDIVRGPGARGGRGAGRQARRAGHPRGAELKEALP